MNPLARAARAALRPLKHSRLVRAANPTLSTTVAGRRYRILLINGMGLVNVGMREQWMVDVLRLLLPVRPGAFVDIGANVGQTLLKAKAVAPEVAYVGFEPNPASAYYVSKLIEANALPSCTLVPVGVGATTELAALHFYDDQDAGVGASLAAEFRPDDPVRRTQVVPVFTLEAGLAAIGVDQVGVLKVDAEGIEVDILEAARSLLMSQHPAILVEILPAYSPDHRFRVGRQERLVRLVQQLGYVLHEVVLNSDNSLRGVRRVEAIEVHADPRRTDYLALPVGDATLAAVQVA
ncbi:MAG: FkbM family methyltransferase [Bacteroidota bacterium]